MQFIVIIKCVFVCDREKKRDRQRECACLCASTRVHALCVCACTVCVRMYVCVHAPVLAYVHMTIRVK